ncbi:hypothetical protein PAF04_06135 [Pseudomonas aeruginosa]|uniref:hypothetical protein n=1 Tax=Pseudomonas aeruginosa TaxID=287 RepID=UPI0034A2ECA2
MLYLRTGLPGAGKTLNAIREIDIEHQPDPDDPTKRLHKDPTIRTCRPGRSTTTASRI